MRTIKQSIIRHWLVIVSWTLLGLASTGAEDILVSSDGSEDIENEYLNTVRPLLKKYCYDCHAEGADEGGFKLDGIEDQSILINDQETWSKVIKNVRAGVMPPENATKPSEEDIEKLSNWIKCGPFKIDPKNVDPGRVTLHRLNRIEYQNTIQQLLRVRFNANDEFPPDAAGMGLDNIAELQTMSALLLEKYLNAAESVLEGAFPSKDASPVVIPGNDIRGDNKSNGKYFSFNKPPELTYTFRNTVPGTFRLKIELDVIGLKDEEKQFIANFLLEQAAKAAEKAEKERAEKEVKALAEKEGVPSVQPKEEIPQGRFGRGRTGGLPSETPLQTAVSNAHFVVTVQSGIARPEKILEQNFSSEPGSFHFEVDQVWGAEPHTINFNIVMPGSEIPEPPRPFFFQRGPQPKPLPAPHIVLKSLLINQRPTDAGRLYFGSSVPGPKDAHVREFIQKGIAEFGLRAFRRPMDAETIEFLVEEVLTSYKDTSNFNESLKPALAKLLCSPRFLFRMDRTIVGQETKPWGEVDEFSLASRLAFFLWSGPPDDELLKLADRGELRSAACGAPAGA